MFELLKEKGFQIEMLHHGEAILSHDMPSAAKEIESVLIDLQIPVEELVYGGGGEGRGTQRLRRALVHHGWNAHNFEIKKIVDGIEKESISHKIDHVKKFSSGIFALEIEWNNKDPFYDRDLENFKRLHSDGVISIGAIITRGRSLQDGLRAAITAYASAQGVNEIAALSKFYAPTVRQARLIEAAAVRFGSFEEGWAHTFVSDKFGEATTHWRKLDDRVRRGVGSPCPLLLIGIPDSVLTL